jgi:hypothetical protein
LTSNDPKTDVQERFVLSANSAGTARLSYEYTNQRQQLRVDIDQSVDVTIDQRPRGESEIPTVSFRQPQVGDVLLTVEDGDLVRDVACASIWHLLLTEPDLCGTYLVPILHSLRPDWVLDEKAQRAETALLADARRGHLPDTAKMERLVRQLQHAEFSRRQAADRELRQMGHAAAGFLGRLDESALDVEQRTRIRRICESLHGNTGDTPARVALWLAEDRVIWLALLQREDIATRQLAARHLGVLIGRPLAFAPDASAPERRGQLHRLRVELGLDEPVLATAPGDSLHR